MFLVVAQCRPVGVCPPLLALGAAAASGDTDRGCFVTTPSSVSSDTEDASETDLAKHDEEDYVEMKEQ